MDRPGDFYTKESKSDRERQTPYDTTYMWNLKHDTNKHIYNNRNKLIDIENRLVVAKGVGVVRREGLGV